MCDFTDQVAVVTGATSGIGQAIALSLAAQGATVCLIARNLEKLEAMASLSQKFPSELVTYQTDLTSEQDLSRLTTRLHRDYKQIDIIVHSAGAYGRGSLACTPVSEFDILYRTNVFAPYALTQALLPMLSHHRGQIVFINSSVGLSGQKTLSQYSATKHALKAIADSLRAEVNSLGIRVMSIFLGRTATPLQESIHAMENKTYRPELLIQPQDVAAVITNALGLPRTAEVTEISMRPLNPPAI